MNQTIKQQWISALRGGDYHQTKHSLKSNDGYCCLGVLCDLYAKVKNKEWEQDKILGYMMEGVDNILPDSVVEWAELDADDPIVSCIVSHLNEEDEVTLSVLNDQACYTFDQIANVIEVQL